MRSVLLLLLGLALASAPVHAFQKVLDVYSLLNPTGQREPDWIDLEGDGLQDLYTVEDVTPMQFQFDIVKVDGSVPWSFTLDTRDLADHPTVTSWRILGIDDFDSAPGREVLMLHQGDPPYGFILVSIQSETVLWEWPEVGGQLSSTRLVDLNGDGRKEFVLVLSFTGFDRTQIWSYGALAGAADPGGSSNGSPACAVPNPSSGPSRITFDLPSSGPMSIELLDVQGRVVRRLIDGVGEAGPITLPWDGRDDIGRDLPSGIYFARIQTQEGTRSSKLVLTR